MKTLWLRCDTCSTTWGTQLRLPMPATAFVALAGTIRCPKCEAASHQLMIATEDDIQAALLEQATKKEAAE